MLDTVAEATALLLVRLMATGPGMAGHSSITMALIVVPPRIRLGDSVSVCARIGRTVKVSDCDTPPNLAVTIPDAERRHGNGRTPRTSCCRRRQAP